MTNCHRQTWWAVSTNGGTTGRVDPLWTIYKPSPPSFSISLSSSVWLRWTWMGKLIFMVQETGWGVWREAGLGL